jgi:hypothetical protein
MKKIYNIFAKLAAEGDRLHLTASLNNTPPDGYHFLRTQQAFSKEDAILRFNFPNDAERHQLKRLLKDSLTKGVSIIQTYQN